MKLSKSIIHTAGSICLLFIILLIPVCAKAQSLGSVDISSEPEDCAGKIDKTQIVLCQFIKPGKHSPKVLEFADAAFDQMAFFV